MKLLLHVGMGKTGTTTLQKSFRRHKDVLLASGVLYPTQHSFPLRDHQGVMCLTGNEPESLPREFGKIRSQSVDEMARLADDFWDDICAEAREVDPEVVILSYESLFYLKPDALRSLAQRLTTLTSEIEVIAYVRHPSTHWLAVAQQRVKASHRVNPPGRYKNELRRHLEDFQGVFGASVFARAFDRAALINGCIVADFIEHYLPDSDRLSREIVAETSNESMSGEAMCIMQEFRRHAFGDRPNQFAPESNEVLRVLRELEPETPQSPPRLRAGIRSALTERHHDDLLWLEQTFDMRFPSALEESAEARAGLDAEVLQSANVSEILDVSDDEVAETLYALLASLSRRPRRGFVSAWGGRASVATR